MDRWQHFSQLALSKVSDGLLCPTVRVQVRPVHTILLHTLTHSHTHTHTHTHTQSTLEQLSHSCDEFLIHGVDVEGMQLGIDDALVETLGR